MTARPIRYQRQVLDRNGKIFYTSITSLYPCRRLLHSRLETAGGTPPYRKVRTNASGIFKRSPPSQIEYIDTDRRIVDISCRPE